MSRGGQYHCRSTGGPGVGVPSARRDRWRAFVAAFFGWMLDGYDFTILTLALLGCLERWGDPRRSPVGGIGGYSDRKAWNDQPGVGGQRCSTPVVPVLIEFARVLVGCPADRRNWCRSHRHRPCLRGQSVSHRFPRSRQWACVPHGCGHRRDRTVCPRRPAGCVVVSAWCDGNVYRHRWRIGGGSGLDWP